MAFPTKKQNRNTTLFVIAWIVTPFIFGSMDMMGLALLSGIAFPVALLIMSMMGK